ncbi:hypothetical protein E2C01_092889 [Portunus trituberculatus]|uniref:Uncharacterized protein n=1 Tax=Portunus trituberculatus TaxID=210409 RepID=A0A5B7JRW2_PORTR|nr:hypothetical protein [Portunus trituberculatus]
MIRLWARPAELCRGPAPPAAWPTKPQSHSAYGSHVQRLTLDGSEQERLFSSFLLEMEAVVSPL